jgi:hypothetical protein
MRLKEFDLLEKSYIDPALTKDFKNRGLTLIGKGRDQQAWRTPAGTVLKIFGTQKGSQGLSPDQQMMIFWVDYCRKNSQNLYLPMFGQVEQFRFPADGDVYLKVEMEPLTRLPKPQEDLLGQIELFIDKGRTLDYLTQIAKQRMGPKLAGLAPILPKLWATVEELDQIAQSKGWRTDLSDDNWLSRAGTPVAADPWVAS